MNPTRKQDLSVSMEKAGVYSLVFALPVAVLLSLFYIWRWGWAIFWDGIDSLAGNFLFFLLAFVLGIVVHELIHGLTWAAFGKKPLSAIQFGFQVKTFTPYAHCKVPLEVNAYRLGTLMPCLLLGILPAVLAILNGNGGLLAFGLLFTIAAGGDMVIVWLIRGVPAGRLVEDHPTQAGCYVIDPAEG